ncbi:hypothetical protein [Streptomyces galilaeus]|uniref:hypothetical protein n=1 Tax=Streptomyces galilaeus TaxID=33899 RepID=UPI001677B577|nr:hypothetical protein [Streptomyces galilaeus]
MRKNGIAGGGTGGTPEEQTAHMLLCRLALMRQVANRLPGEVFGASEERVLCYPIYRSLSPLLLREGLLKRGFRQTLKITESGQRYLQGEVWPSFPPSVARAAVREDLLYWLNNNGHSSTDPCLKLSEYLKVTLVVGVSAGVAGPEMRDLVARGLAVARRPRVGEELFAITSNGRTCLEKGAWVSDFNGPQSGQQFIFNKPVTAGTVGTSHGPTTVHGPHGLALDAQTLMQYAGFLSSVLTPRSQDPEQWAVIEPEQQAVLNEAVVLANQAARGQAVAPSKLQSAIQRAQATLLALAAGSSAVTQAIGAGEKLLGMF